MSDLKQYFRSNIGFNIGCTISIEHDGQERHVLFTSVDFHKKQASFEVFDSLDALKEFVEKGLTYFVAKKASNGSH